MHIGCTLSKDLGADHSLENVSKAREVGYDFVECRVASLLPKENGSAFMHAMEHFRNMELPAQVFSLFIPPDLKIVGPNIEHKRLKLFTKTVIQRMHAMGGRVLVFGSGEARKIPEGFPLKDAIQQIVEFLQEASTLIPHDCMTIVIEPQYRKETNVINSIPEAVEIAQKVGHPCIKVMADLNHMIEENEPLEHLVQFVEWIKHIHVADSDRLPPGYGNYPFEKFGEILKKSGYSDRISAECYWSDFSLQIKSVYQFLEKVFA